MRRSGDPYAQTPFIRSLRAIYGGDVQIPVGWMPMLPSPLPTGVVDTPDIIALEGKAYIVRQANINAVLNGDNTILVGIQGKKLTVISIDFVLSAAATVAWYSNPSATGGKLLRSGQPFAANSGMLRDLVRPYFVQTNGGEPLIMNLSAAVTLTGGLGYCEVEA